MTASKIRRCQCPNCQRPEDHPDKEKHRDMNLFLSRLNEQQRRIFVAMESKRMGYGGNKLLFQITGMDVKTIRQGRRELDTVLEDILPNRQRKSGGGRPLVEKKSCHRGGLKLIG